jgi:hypothetical protein
MALTFSGTVITIYRMFQEERSVFWGGPSIGHSKQNSIYICVCPIPNGFRARAISLYSSKIVDKKEILRTVSNTGIFIVQVKKLVQFT